MQGFKTFYRIRIGDYRMGVELEDTSTLRFIVVLHHKDIYKKFPQHISILSSIPSLTPLMKMSGFFVCIDAVIIPTQG
jgi:hypothetical protein